MRLDVLLVKKGYFRSRNRAKEAIKRGRVTVNDRVVTKPSADVDINSKIEVHDRDVPRGYWKLKMLDEAFNLFSGKEVVLDLGSSAGGFVIYASEKAREVYGIEFSHEFEGVLREIERQKPNVRIFIADAFTFDPRNLPKLDVILNDLTLPFSSSMVALKRFLPRLKPSGKVLFVHKSGDGEEVNFEGFSILDHLASRDRKEEYYLLSC